MTTRSITLATIQHACSASKTENLGASIKGIRSAAAEGAQLILLQELHTTQYFCDSQTTAAFEHAEPIPGYTTDRLAELANELSVVIVASLFESRGHGVHHNTAVVLERDGAVAGLYRKMHIPDDPGYNEKYYFTPGDLGFEPINTSLGRLGVLVCWDQWFPEAARIMALKGAEILLYPTAIGWDPSDTQAEQSRQHSAWETLQRGHAIANHLPVVVANRIGEEAKNTFWGGSFIAGPQGEVLAKASHAEPEVLIQTVDLNRTRDLRRVWPFFRDRRIDAYDPLLSL